ncbi:MAG: sulfurtransferase complex subunit TusC [Pseudohongiellaceae bacterium]
MTSPTPPKVLAVVTRHAPYGSHKAQQSLDIALAAAVFEQTVNYIFIGDGVFQLIKHQNATSIQSKTLTNALGTLDLYGIESVYADRASLVERNLDVADLALGAKIIDQDEISNLLKSSDNIFNL